MKVGKLVSLLMMNFESDCDVVVLGKDDRAIHIDKLYSISETNCSNPQKIAALKIDRDISGG
jgi:hypothetical protein